MDPAQVERLWIEGAERTRASLGAEGDVLTGLSDAERLGQMLERVVEGAVPTRGLMQAAEALLREALAVRGRAVVALAEGAANPARSGDPSTATLAMSAVQSIETGLKAAYDRYLEGRLEP